MTLAQAIIEAIESLNGNKLRSSLTVLGIVIGVAAVISMLAVGRGAQNAITDSIGGLGTNLLFVFEGGADESVRNTRPVTLGDAKAIENPFLAPSVEIVAPLLQVNTSVSFGGNSSTPEVIGATPDYFRVRNYSLIEGEFFSEEHMIGRASVALVAPDVAVKLFERTEGLVGETIRIEGQPFRILGILASKGGGSFGSEDNRVVIPLTTAQVRLVRRSNVDEIDFMIIQAINPKAVPQAVEEVSAILRQRHRTEIGADDFTIFTQEDFLSTASSVAGVLTVFLGGIAGISLLVGGIGIMNIMLVSVTERTREIGLRKALGARKRDILIQFLTESSLLSLFGGLIGIALGWLISFSVGRVAASNNVAFSPVVDINAILLATLFSASVGLFFGIYPASRAANLEPVEALRYE